MRTPFLEGESIMLSPLGEADAETCYPWFLDIEVRSFLSSKALPNTLEKSKKFISSINESDNDVLLGIFLTDGKRHIGNVALHGIDFINRNACLGIAIGEKEYRGRGIGREAAGLILEYAFTALNLNMVYLNVFSDNLRAIASYEKSGFKKCATIPQCFYRASKYIDCLIMAVVRHDYEASRSNIKNGGMK